MKFRFTHAADLHLDTPFTGISIDSPEIANHLANASLDAFDSLVNLTIAKEAKFLLLTGDIYDGFERGVRAQFKFIQGLKSLAKRRLESILFKETMTHYQAGQRLEIGLKV